MRRFRVCLRLVSREGEAMKFLVQELCQGEPWDPHPRGNRRKQDCAEGQAGWHRQAQLSHAAQASATLLGIVVELGWPFSVPLADKMLSVGCPLQRGVAWHQTWAIPRGRLP